LIILSLAEVWLRRKRSAALGLVIGVVGVPLGLVAAQALAGMNIPTPRALMFLAPLVYVLAAAGLYDLMRQIFQRLRRSRFQQATAGCPVLLPALGVVATVGLGMPTYLQHFVPYEERADYQDEGYEGLAIAQYLAQAAGPGDGIYLEMCCISTQIEYYLPPHVVADQWSIGDATRRVFFVPGAWVTLDLFEEQHGESFQLVGPVTTIGRDTVYLFERRQAP
jgi:hypothetical protein